MGDVTPQSPASRVIHRRYERSAMNQKKARSPAKIMRYGFLALCCLVLLAACGNNMRDDSRLKPYEASPVFSDGSSARPIDPNALARSQSVDIALTSGKQNGAVVTAF